METWGSFYEVCLNVFFVGCQGSLFMLCAEVNEEWVKFDLQCVLASRSESGGGRGVL